MMAKSGSLQTILLTGTIGAGKTAVAVDIGDVMEATGSATAVIDLDWLGWVAGLPQDQGNVEGLIHENLAAVWPNFRAAGAERFVLARVVRSRGQLDALRSVIPGAELTVVRLKASKESTTARLRQRDSGAILDEHLVRTIEFEKILDDVAIEDFVVTNEDRSIRDVAVEVIRRAGWGDYGR